MTQGIALVPNLYAIEDFHLLCFTDFYRRFQPVPRDIPRDIQITPPTVTGAETKKAQPLI